MWGGAPVRHYLYGRRLFLKMVACRTRQVLVQDRYHEMTINDDGEEGMCARRGPCIPICSDYLSRDNVTADDNE